MLAKASRYIGLWLDDKKLPLCKTYNTPKFKTKEDKLIRVKYDPRRIDKTVATITHEKYLLYRKPVIKKRLIFRK